MFLIIGLAASPGRSQVLRPDLLDRFQRFSLQVGILPENILLLPQNGMLLIL